MTVAQQTFTGEARLRQGQCWPRIWLITVKPRNLTGLQKSHSQNHIRNEYRLSSQQEKIVKFTLVRYIFSIILIEVDTVFIPCHRACRFFFYCYYYNTYKTTYIFTYTYSYLLTITYSFNRFLFSSEDKKTVAQLLFFFAGDIYFYC